MGMVTFSWVYQSRFSQKTQKLLHVFQVSKINSRNQRLYIFGRNGKLQFFKATINVLSLNHQSMWFFGVLWEAIIIFHNLQGSSISYPTHNSEVDVCQECVGELLSISDLLRIHQCSCLQRIAPSPSVPLSKFCARFPIGRLQAGTIWRRRILRSVFPGLFYAVQKKYNHILFL